MCVCLSLVCRSVTHTLSTVAAVALSAVRLRRLILVTRTLLYCFLSAWPTFPLCPPAIWVCQDTHTHTQLGQGSSCSNLCLSLTTAPLKPISHRGEAINGLHHLRSQLLSLFFSSDIRNQNLFSFLSQSTLYIFIQRAEQSRVYIELLYGRFHQNNPI